MAVSLGLWRYGDGVASAIGLIAACLFGLGCLAALAATEQPNRLELNAAGFTVLRLGRAPMRVAWSDVTTFAVQPGCLATAITNRHPHRQQPAVAVLSSALQPFKTCAQPIRRIPPHRPCREALPTERR